MVRRFVVLFITLIITVSVYAQLEVKENSFKEVPGFVNINIDKMYDDNDKLYAVLKIKTENISSKERRELSFKGDAQTFFEIEYKDGEVWLYISYYATFIKISHEEFSSTEFYFPYDMKPKCGYELTLINKSETISSGWASLTLTTSPENGAEITLNGREIDQTTPYTNNMLPSGKYDITVSKFGFESVTKTIVIDDGQTTGLNIEMPYKYGSISVVSDPDGASVFVDDVEYGKTPLVLNNIKYGTHELKIKKEKLKTYKKQFIINNEDAIAISTVLKNCPDGAIEGLFSVSDNKQVYFSKGNLQYNIKNKIWRFAENQWDCIGEKNKKMFSSIPYKGWIDLFGWGTGNDPTKHDGHGYDYKEFIDWGNNNISNGDSVSWRTLTEEEWNYILYKRETKSGKRYFYAQVNNINGVVVLPDDWDASIYDNEYYTTYDANIISMSEWNIKFMPNGAVFLPAAGYRFCRTYDYDWTVYRCGKDYFYWSSSKNDTRDELAYCYTSGGSFFSIGESRSDGCSVRLVCDVE